MPILDVGPNLDDPSSRGGRTYDQRAENRAKIWLTLAMWGSTFVAFTLLSLLGSDRAPGPAAAMRAAVMLLGIGFCYALHRLLQSMRSRRFSTRAATLIIAAPVVAEIFAWINYFGFAWLSGAPLAFVVEDWNAAIRQLLLYTWFFIAWSGLYLAIEYSFLARGEQQRAAELQIHAHRAKLRALSNQLNPHFLFNSLNSISALVLEGKREDGDKALGLLSSYFRQTLSLDPIADLPLWRELDFHRTYLAVEQLRYPDMQVQIDLPDSLRDAAVPALILQPIIENAIKHGVARSKPPTVVRVVAGADAGRLVLRVENKGATEARAPRGEGHGIGLDNIRGRLRERFGSEQELATITKEDGFEVKLSFPLTFL
ncbi:sensor histidine kinase [Pelagerythrobacter aerophilus]|nr:histidine kinase [Pelagerythrobacter aerophilus]